MPAGLEWKPSAFRVSVKPCTERFLLYRKLRPIKQNPPGDAHFALRENGCCGNRAPARESGKTDSLLFKNSINGKDKILLHFFEWCIMEKDRPSAEADGEVVYETFSLL